MTARRRITQDRNAVWFCALVQIRSAPCSADLVSECQEIGASECNTTLLRSTFISVWSVCRMTIKFPAKIATWPAFHLERSSRRWRKKAIYWLAITRLSSSVCRRALRPAPRSRVRRLRRGSEPPCDRGAGRCWNLAANRQRIRASLWRLHRLRRSQEVLRMHTYRTAARAVEIGDQEEGDRYHDRQNQ